MFMLIKAPFLALLSAALFGLAPALGKLLVGSITPILLSGLFYLGSAIALLPGLHWRETRRTLPSMKADAWKLVGAIGSGGIIAPALMCYGISLGSAFEVSLLLNFEMAATALIAALLFGEHVSPWLWFAIGVITLAALLLSFHAEGPRLFSPAVFLVLGACLFWGLDNNLTRAVGSFSPVQIACLKGLIAGTFNALMGLLVSKGLPTLAQTSCAVGVGAISFGLSLVLFVVALRHLGAARTSAYFSSAPFLGMIFALLILSEPVTPVQWLAAAIFLMGIAIVFLEQHSHRHCHAAITHSHRHTHDLHHQHPHDEPSVEPHEHSHRHEACEHEHAHYPDIHHRHRH